MRKALGRPYFKVYEKKDNFFLLLFRTARSLCNRLHFMMNMSLTDKVVGLFCLRRHFECMHSLVFEVFKGIYM